MEYTILGHEKNIVHVCPSEPILDVQSALDLISTATYDTDCRRLVLDKICFARDFLILSTGLAGEILQKFVNYRVKSLSSVTIRTIPANPSRGHVFRWYSDHSRH